jgi:hypothetical protein
MSDFSDLPRYQNAYSDLPTEIPCSWCGKHAYNLKSYTLITIIFLGVFIVFRSDRVTNCPRCMRKALLQRTLVNLLTANLLSPIVIVWHGVLFLGTFVGHQQKWSPHSENMT